MGRRSQLPARLRATRLASLGGLALALLALPSCGVLAAFVEVFTVQDICEQASLDGTHRAPVELYAGLVEQSESTAWLASMIWTPGVGIDTLEELGETSRAAVCVYYSQLSQLRSGWAASSDDADAKDILRITLVHSADEATSATAEVRERIETLFAASQEMRLQMIDVKSRNPDNASVAAADESTKAFHDAVEELTYQWRFVDDQLVASAAGVHATDTEDAWGAEFFPEDLESAYVSLEAMLETFNAL